MEPATASANGDLLELKSMFKSYGTGARQFVALRDVNLRIRQASSSACSGRPAAASPRCSG